MADIRELAKWRAAHQGISIPDIALETVAPFPSLYAGDFAVYLEASGGATDMVQFVRDMSREMAWTYDNWAKAQRDADTAKLIDNMLSNCSGEGGGGDYSITRKFIQDYARANGIALSSDPTPQRPSWMDSVRGTGTVTEG